MEATKSPNSFGCRTFSANVFNTYNTCHDEYCKVQGTTARGDCDNARAASTHGHSTTISIPTSMSSMLKLGRERRNQWRAHHEEFKVIMRRLRGVQTEPNSTATESWIESSNSSLQRCSHCNRTFNEAAFSKHVERCREACSDISRKTGVNHEKAEAMERFRCRMRCKPKFRVNEQHTTVSSRAYESNTDYVDSACLSLTSSASLNSRLTDSSSSDSTTTFIKSSACFNTERSSWDSAGQSSNCNHVRTPQEKSSEPKVSRESSSFLSANTEKTDLDKLTDVNFNSPASLQQPPFCNTPSPVACSSPSTASSLSTVSLLQSGRAREIPPVSGDRSSKQPSHRKKSHCPWSPSTSSFLNPTNASEQKYVLLQSAFSSSGTPCNSACQSGTPTNEAPLQRTGSLSTGQNNIACTATARILQRPPRIGVDDSALCPSVNMGYGSANSSVQCNLKPSYSHRRTKCKHMHKSCSRSLNPSRSDIKQTNCAVHRPRPFDSAPYIQSPRLVEGDTHEWLLQHPMSAITKMEEAQLIRHSNSSVTSLQEVQAIGAKECTSRSRRPNYDDWEENLLIDKENTSCVAAKEITEMDWTTAQVGRSGDLTHTKSPRDDGVCLVFDSALSSCPLSRADSKPADTNSQPIISSVGQIGSQCGRHPEMTSSKGSGHTSKVLQTYQPGFPTALALTKAMLHRPHLERQAEHLKREYHLTIELDESDVDDVNLKPENTLLNHKMTPWPLPAVYCHECGKQYATDCAKYCSGCGTSRPIPCIPAPPTNHIQEKSNLNEASQKDPALQVDRCLGRFAQLTAEVCPFQ
ncbi:unnamed protein product [Dicrocoelium dendriticum]|nr:unnamed protein product [Dicrocoelium dendriticum]